MKKFCVFLLIITLCSSFNFAQSKKAVSILGDSYSTFEGYLQPDTNSIWYYSLPRHKTDVVSVRQTWWHQLIRENDYRLCVNNSFSGATICNTGYRKADPFLKEWNTDRHRNSGACDGPHAQKDNEAGFCTHGCA